MDMPDRKYLSGISICGRCHGNYWRIMEKNAGPAPEDSGGGDGYYEDAAEGVFVWGQQGLL